jgi:hypothetical protein
MPSKQPKFRNRGEASHWSRAKAAFVSTFNWPAKRKASMQMVNRLAADAADESLLEYRQRASR